MDSTELFPKLLGIAAPGRITRVAVNVLAVRIDLRVEEAAGTTSPCPTSQAPAAVYELRLKGTRYLWLWNAEWVPGRRHAEFEAVKHANLQASRSGASRTTFARSAPRGTSPRGTSGPPNRT